MVPAEAVELLYRSELAHRAIRLSAIPLDHSLIIGHLRYELSQSTDAYLLARTDIHMAVAERGAPLAHLRSSPHDSP